MMWGPFVHSLLMHSPPESWAIRGHISPPTAALKPTYAHPRPERIFDQFTNLKAYFTGILYPDADLTAEPMQWLRNQDVWIKEQVCGTQPTFC